MSPSTSCPNASPPTSQREPCTIPAPGAPRTSAGASTVAPALARNEQMDRIPMLWPRPGSAVHAVTVPWNPAASTARAIS